MPSTDSRCTVGKSGVAGTQAEAWGLLKEQQLCWQVRPSSQHRGGKAWTWPIPLVTDAAGLLGSPPVILALTPPVMIKDGD